MSLGWARSDISVFRIGRERCARTRSPDGCPGGGKKRDRAQRRMALFGDIQHVAGAAVAIGAASSTISFGDGNREPGPIAVTEY